MFVRRFIAILMVGVALTLMGCSPDSDSPTSSPSAAAPTSTPPEPPPLSVEQATKLMTEAQPELAFPPLTSVFVEGEWAVGLTNGDLTVLFRWGPRWFYAMASSNWPKEGDTWCDQLTGRIELRLGC